MRGGPALTRIPALIAVLIAAALAGCGTGTTGARPVTLILDFTPNGAHAGIYAAVAGGLDRARGIRLVVRQPSATSDSLELLGAGRADLAIADIHDLALARARGKDLVGVGALVQRPLAAVIAVAAARPRDLAGKTVGVTGVPSDDAVLRSVLSGDGADPRNVHELTIGFSAVPSLIARKVAAATAFWDVEGVTLRRHGVATREFRVERYGAPRYPELVVVARRDTIRRQPQVVRAALAALADGTRRAIANPQAAASEIAAASAGDPALVRAEIESLRTALTPPLAFDARALAAWAAWDVRFGILSSRPDLSRAFDLTLAPRR